MAYPPAYTRAFSFTDWETLHPGEPKPGDKLDTEYDAVSNAITGTQTALALIQRADGKLANASVGEDQLEPGIFDGIADGITDDAQAAADAAAASAGSAATSAASASSNAALAVTSRNEAAGFAAQAGVSQGIAQGAGSDAAAMADDAADSAAAAANSANEAQGFRNEAEGHEQLAFDWAEKLEGPVEPAPPGWPEAVDDGMFSSKWWAIRARDYNETSTLDFGTAGTDIGDAFVIWDAIPGNELPLGQVYATWGSPVQTYVLTDHDHPEDPASWTNITGGPGPPNVLSIGTVITGAPGSVATVTITGTSPAQVLNMSIPRGDVGATGPAGPTGAAGPPNALAVGTVTTGAAGSAAVVTITGISPSQTINFTIPKGDKGDQGIQGIQGPIGPTGPAANLADPTTPIGLVTINGSAATAMRSDAAPALSQAIVPTWTGQHTFSGGNIPVRLQDANFARLQITKTGVGNWFVGGDGTASNDFTFYASGSQLLRLKWANSGIDFGNATDNGPYNFLGTGAATFGGSLAATNSLTVAGADPTLNIVETDAAANLQRWAWNPSNGNLVLYAVDGGTFKQALAFGRAGGAIVTTINFGNGTDNPTYTFLGTGLTTFNGAVTIFGPSIGTIPLSASNPVGGPAASFNSNHANGPYIQLQRSGTTFGYIGNSGPTLVTGGVLDGIALTTVGASPIIFAYSSGTEGMRMTSGGALQVTGTLGASPLFKAALGMEMGMSGGNGWLQCYNRSSNTYGPMRIDATYANITDGGGGALVYLGGRNAFESPSGDTWLRINNSSQFTSGVYSPGVINSGGGFWSNAGLSSGGAGTPRIRPNLTGTGGLNYGSVVADGTTNGYSGYGIGDSLQPVFMSNNSVSGIFVITDSKWLINRTSASAANCDYTLTATAFQVFSSRTLKRETGRITRAADILSKLRPILYRLLSGDDSEQLGLIAEEVNEVCPQLSDGKSVMYDRLALLLLADWQETHLPA